MILLVKLFMSIATVFYVVGLTQRHRNNPLHRKLMLAGFGCTVGIAVVLVVGVQIFGAGYGAALWLVDLAGGEEGAGRVLIIHRIFATLTLLLLIAQIIAGLRRHPIHRRLYLAVVPTWLITYLSGMVIFT